MRESHDIDVLAKAVLSGRMSRRSAFRRAVALGFGASAMVALVKKTNHVYAQDQEPGYSIVVPDNLRTDLAGQKITAILSDSGTGRPFTAAMVQKFQEATGIETTYVEGPTSATDRLNIAYLPVLSAGSSDVDVMMIDVIWPGILASHALDLTQAMADSGNTYFERIVANNTVDGTLVGIPWYTDASVLYYRTDLLEKYGIEAPPTTWGELEQQATAIQEGERASNPDFWGFVWQGKAYEGLTCDALEWQVSQGGGNIIEPDGTVSINNENAAAAFDRAKGWIGTITPEGVTGYQEEESRGVWQAGNAAFMRNWPYAYSLGQADDSVIKDKLDVTLLPMGDGGEGAQHASTLGGWQIMVSKYSQSPDAAIEFAKFATSPQVQKAQAIELSLPPTIAEVYDDADVLAAQPLFGKLKDVFLSGAVPRPSTVSGEFYDDVSTAYFTAVNQVLTGALSGEDAVAGLEEELSAIMEEKG